MAIALPSNALFLPKLKEARATDVPLDAACIKIDGKLEEYARGLRVNLDQLRLLDVCDARGELHPKLLAYIDRIPKLKKQTDARYEKYKQEISSNIQRGIDAVVSLITGVMRERL